MADDNIQHGIDDNPSGDAEKGGVMGAVGGAVVGALAGGPIGAVVGAVAGGLASAAGVAAVDRVDNDNNITGVGSGVTTDTGNVVSSGVHSTAGTVSDTTHTVGATAAGIGNQPVIDNGVPGVQTGGYTNAGTPDTRGVSEKVADAVTGDRLDDKTGHVISHPDHGVAGTSMGSGTTMAANSGLGTGVSTETHLGETTPSIKTGGYANDGTPDTRGAGEKVVDAVTGDTLDDKTGKTVNHP
jgi:hypothetical protein